MYDRKGMGSLVCILWALPLSAGGAIPPGIPIRPWLQGTFFQAANQVSLLMRERDSCLLLCQDAGGVLRVTTGPPSSASRRDCVSTQASPPALHPGLFTLEATL